MLSPTYALFDKIVKTKSILQPNLHCIATKCIYEKVI